MKIDILVSQRYSAGSNSKRLFEVGVTQILPKLDQDSYINC